MEEWQHFPHRSGENRRTRNSAKLFLEKLLYKWNGPRSVRRKNILHEKNKLHFSANLFQHYCSRFSASLSFPLVARRRAAALRLVLYCSHGKPVARVNKIIGGERKLHHDRSSLLKGISVAQSQEKKSELNDKRNELEMVVYLFSFFQRSHEQKKSRSPAKINSVVATTKTTALFASAKKGTSVFLGRATPGKAVVGN